jgi:G:T-mismatch repair DNA endonuclease (very short patch repair protein)
LERRGTRFAQHRAVEGICFPDLVLTDKKTAVFCDGRFRHGRSVHCPKTHDWLRARTRDKEIYEKLRALGWAVVPVWEHGFDANSDVVGERLDELLRAD